jgi:hypothetical protein
VTRALSPVTAQGRLSSANLDDDPSASRAVELAEEDPLPGPEDDRSVLDEDTLAASDERAFAVGVGIALGMAVARAMLGHQLVQRQKDVVLDGGVGVLVDRDGRSGVGTKDNGLAVTDTGVADDRVHLTGDIDHLAPASRADPKIFLNYFHLASALIFSQ